VGDTNLNGKPAPAAATVRARSRMRVLLVRPSDAAALVTQPTIKAALYRTQTEASVLDALETFAAYDDEVAVIDELRRSRTASFAAATRGALVSAGSGIPALGSAHGSGQWLATASSGGSSMLESYGSVASSLVSYVSAASLAPMAEGLPGAGVASAVAAAGRSNPLPVALPLSQPGGSFTSPVRVPSKPELTAGPGSAGGSPLRPGSRGNSFTAGSAAARQQAATPSGLRGTSSRLGLRIQGGQQQPQPQPQPGVNISPLPSPHA
jgi:hypothetical protein